MADITLKAYLAHLDDLLTRRQYEEAEAHCKHILARYPKNLATLKRLAKAQFEAGNLAAAESTYAIVLSMEPRSIDAYVGLSWIARQRGNGPQTIALLERAYEQDTSNNEVIQLLRDAHRTFGDNADAKLPQTQYIAARQQFRSGLAQQAISTLNGALAADPARADIRLLKMGIYRQTGQETEAARLATEVLKQLPDCVEANAMLANFWKAQGRSSDAQRFVTRVEAIEPYLAFEIATGVPTADETLTLSLLNFRAASPATSTETPDWMGALGMDAPADTMLPEVNADSMAWLENAQPVIEEESEQLDESWLSGVTDTSDMPEDLSWLDEATAAQLEQNDDIEEMDDFLANFQSTSDSEPMPSLGVAWMDDATPADEGDTLDSISTKMAREEVKSAEVLDELSALSGDDDTMGENADWMATIESQQSDPTRVDRENFDDFLKNFTNFGDLTPEEAAQSSGTGLTGLLSGLSPSDGEQETAAPLSPDIADIDPEDPLAWMRAGMNDDDADIEMPDLDALVGGNSFFDEKPAAQAEELTFSEPDSNPYAWMQQHDIELTEEQKGEDLWADPMGVSEMTSLDAADVDPLAWMAAAGATLDDEDSGEIDPMAWAREDGLEILDNDYSGQTEPPAAGEPVSSPHEDVTLPSVPPVMTGLLAYVKDENALQEESSPMNDKELPDWLSGSDDESDSGGMESSGELADFDWMAVTPANKSEDEIDWDAAPETGDSDEAVPDWLASLDNPVTPGAAAELSAADDPNIKDIWEDAADDIATPDWMMALRDENTEDAPAAAEDWLFSEGQAAVESSANESEDLLASLSLAADSARDELADALDSAAEAVSDSADAAGDATADWLDDAGEQVEEALPDWLTGSSPTAEAEPEIIASPMGDDLNWLNQPDEASAVETPVEDAMPDWLMNAVPSEAADDVAVAADNIADWLKEEPAEAADAVSDDLSAFAASGNDGAARTADIIDATADDDFNWLQDEPAVDDQPAPPVEPARDDTGQFDWPAGPLNDVDAAIDAAVGEAAGGGERLAAQFDETLDDLFGADDAENDDANQSIEPSYELSYFDDDQPTGDVATVELEGDPLPDWLLESKPEDEAVKIDVDVPADQLEVQGGIAGEILDDAELLEPEPPVEETLSPSAVNSPDWLNAMVPGLEIGGDFSDEDEPVSTSDEFLNGGRGDYGWLNDIVDGELAPPVTAAPSRRVSRFPFSELPVWLTGLREITQGAAPVVDFDEDGDDLPDWLNFDDAETN